MKTLLLLTAVIFSTTAQAVPYVSTLPDNVGHQWGFTNAHIAGQGLNGGSVLLSDTAPMASDSSGATLTFDLVGYGSVDGNNFARDTFELTINNDLLFSGGFRMGGGGSRFTNFIDPDVTVVSTRSFGRFRGGLTQFSVNFDMLAGVNDFLFDYGRMQPLFNEGWGVRNLNITANLASVPSPGAMMLILVGMIALVAVRKKKAVV